MRLRPYKSCDAKTIEKWINDKGVFQKFYEKIRSIFLEYILHVERQIKSLLSYHFCEKYGEYRKRTTSLI